MPEMPEVQALADDLSRRLEGRAVAAFRLAAFSALKTFDPPPDALAGMFVEGVTRHGKFLDVRFDGLHLIAHLARAGWVHWRESPGKPPRPGGKSPIAVRVELDDGQALDLTEAGTKKSLAIYVVRDPADVPGIAGLGPDPLTLDLDGFRRVLAAAGRSQIKGVLRDQSQIAGIGNAYSDEILHAARMSPFKPAALTADESQALYDAMQRTLREAVERSAGVAASDLKAEKRSGMAVHGRTGEACPVCGDVVREVSFADSSLQYCATCQTGGKILADRRMSRLLK